MIERQRANRALTRLRKRITFWKRKAVQFQISYWHCNDQLGNARWREQDPRFGLLAEIMRLKGLRWEKGTLRREKK